MMAPEWVVTGIEVVGAAAVAVVAWEVARQPLVWRVQRFLGDRKYRGRVRAELLRRKRFPGSAPEMALPGDAGYGVPRDPLSRGRAPEVVLATIVREQRARDVLSDPFRHSDEEIASAKRSFPQAARTTHGDQETFLDRCLPADGDDIDDLWVPPAFTDAEEARIRAIVGECITWYDQATGRAQERAHFDLLMKSWGVGNDG